MINRGYKSTYNRKNANLEDEMVEIDEAGNETILKTYETRESKIKKTILFTEEQKLFLIELFKS